MAKKSMKAAAAAGTTVFDTITAGAQTAQNAQGAQPVIDSKNAPNAQDVKAAQGIINAKDAQNAKTTGRPKTHFEEQTRLSLKIPVEVKDYLQAAAYRESSPRHIVSLTEYLVKIVYEDMEKHKND